MLFAFLRTFLLVELDQNTFLICCRVEKLVARVGNLFCGVSLFLNSLCLMKL